MNEKQIPELMIDAAVQLQLAEESMRSVNDHGEITGFCDTAETIDRQLKFALREAIVNARRLRSRIELFEEQGNREQE